MGNLATNKVYSWKADDNTVSETMLGFFANFVKTGNPNGPSLPEWPEAKNSQVMRIDVSSRAEPEQNRERYLFLDQFYSKIK